MKHQTPAGVEHKIDNDDKEEDDDNDDIVLCYSLICFFILSCITHLRNDTLHCRMQVEQRHVTVFCACQLCSLKDEQLQQLGLTSGACKKFLTSIESLYVPLENCTKQQQKIHKMLKIDTVTCFLQFSYLEVVEQLKSYNVDGPSVVLMLGIITLLKLVKS